MAQTLEEFLVSIKYNVDASSSQRFFDMMKRTAGSVSGVAAEIVGLTTAVSAFAERMARVGDNLYWMSQRLGDSIVNIQTTAEAMSTLGMSTDEAYQNMERFGGWMRSYGPAATGFLRTLGVTSRDTNAAMAQLAQTLYARGLRPGMEGTQAYAMQMQYLNLIPGMTEQFVRTIPLLAQREAAMLKIAETVWGGRSGAQAGQQAFGAQSNQMVLQFAQLQALFTNIAEKMALNVFPAVQRFMQEIINYGPELVRIFDDVSKGLATFVDFVAQAMHYFHDLPEVFKLLAVAIVGLPTALNVLLSPLGMVIAGFTALMLLMADYKAWQWDQAHHQHGHSAFNWGDDTMFGKLKEAGEWIGQFSEKHPWMVGVLAGVALLILRFRALGAAIAFAGFAASPLGAAIAAAIAAGLAVWAGTQKAVEGYDKGLKDPSLSKNPFGPGINLDPTTGMPIISDPDAGKGLGGGKVLDWIGGWLGGLFGGMGKIDLSHSSPQIVGSARRRGGYQLASIGDSWMPPSAFGGDSDDPNSGLFRMLRDRLDMSNETLTNIFETLEDIGDAMGAGRDARTGTGGYGSATPGQTASTPEQVEYAKALAKRLGIPAEAAAGIVANLVAESGLDPKATSSSGAHGAMQWIHSRWGPLAAWARSKGFDPETREGQREMVAHDMEQNFPALLAELKRGGSATQLARRFFYEAEAAHYGPLLTPGNWASHTSRAESLARGVHGGSVSNSITIHITAPSPASAAHQTADAVSRVLEDHGRMTRGAFA